MKISKKFGKIFAGSLIATAAVVSVPLCVVSCSSNSSSNTTSSNNTKPTSSSTSTTSAYNKSAPTYSKLVATVNSSNASNSNLASLLASWTTAYDNNLSTTSIENDISSLLNQVNAQLTVGKTIKKDGITSKETGSLSDINLSVTKNASGKYMFDLSYTENISVTVHMSAGMMLNMSTDVSSFATTTTPTPTNSSGTQAPAPTPNHVITPIPTGTPTPMPTPDSVPTPTSTPNSVPGSTSSASITLTATRQVSIQNGVLAPTLVIDAPQTPTTTMTSDDHSTTIPSEVSSGTYNVYGGFYMKSATSASVTTTMNKQSVSGMPSIYENILEKMLNISLNPYNSKSVTFDQTVTSTTINGYSLFSPNSTNSTTIQNPETNQNIKETTNVSALSLQGISITSSSTPAPLGTFKVDSTISITE